MKVMVTLDGDMEFKTMGNKGHGFLEYRGGRLFVKSELARAFTPSVELKHVELGGNFSPARDGFGVQFEPTDIIKIVAAGK